MHRQNNMVKKLVLCLVTLCLAFDFITPGPLHEDVSMPMMPRAHKKPGPVKSIFKRNVIGCQNDTQYPFQGRCCDSCKPGSFAKRKGCTKDNRTTSCEKCIDGEEYMDNYNYHPKCLRCSHCDSEHGFEVEKNCTIHQNVKCRCKSGYFCNSSEPCRHCAPCDECKGGKILESCTQTNNTRCDRTEIVQDKKAEIIAPVVVVLGISITGIGIMCYVCKKKKTAKYNVKEPPNGMEMEPLHYPGRKPKEFRPRPDKVQVVTYCYGKGETSQCREIPFWPFNSDLDIAAPAYLWKKGVNLQQKISICCLTFLLLQRRCCCHRSCLLFGD
ncbi:tumor necrosis factor receptor superfamily member 6 isoform X2 [Zootoca vivipara]|uniref:tumor necrosis factor receptor superfamily member 6 isoform X2 n=1 Tax=Zootoca vivipara TaxID=8524 RepID=UPI00293C0EB6|nr:tumor necrosis factor receptor superfamily member 6 isoform X2 [Zootoca vivipara]